jgi:catechol 2,3-dioxygenase-like lactoylglutathione lyase family enzyme
MITALDHIIIGVKDLDEATRTFRDNLGLVPSGGGVHTTGGTANRIIVIGDTYLELIAIRTPTEAQTSMVDRLAKGEGFLNFVLSSNDMQADSEAMKQRGVSLLGPQKGTLQAGDGRSRSWMRADIERPDLTQHYPFLIQHDSTGEERRTRLAGWTTPPLHPLGVSKVLSVTLAIENLSEAAQRFAHIYGLQPSDEYSGEADSWDALLVSFLLEPSMQSFELAAPVPTLFDPANDTVSLPEPGALAAYLQRYGESLCRMTLAVENLAASRRFLDEHHVTYTYKAHPDYPRPVLWIAPDQACGASLVLHEFTPDMPQSNPLVL